MLPRDAFRRLRVVLRYGARGRRRDERGGRRMTREPRLRVDQHAALRLGLRGRAR